MSVPSARRGSATVRLTGVRGEPASGVPVVVEQVSHTFGFGCTGFEMVPPSPVPGQSPVSPAMDPATAARDGRQWLALFNQVTLPLYWRLHEPTRGAPHNDEIAAAARWFRQHGARVKGHPLVWHTLAPQWLLGLSDREVENAVRLRVAREVVALAGLIDEYDAINEAVIMPVFTAEANAITKLAQVRGRVEMVRMAVDTARAAHPSVRLVLNDFDLGPDYAALIEECLEAGVAIDAVGLQMHMHQGYRGDDAVREILERFAGFGLPLEVTETSLVSGELMPADIVDLNDHVVDSWPSTAAGEARQADEVVRLYRTVVGHPAVESITWWGLQDRGQWLGAPAGLVRADGSTKPAYDALHDLVKGEWWCGPVGAVTDADGVVEVEGFAGEYRVTWAGGSVDVAVEVR